MIKEKDPSKHNYFTNRIYNLNKNGYSNLQLFVKIHKPYS